MSELAAPQMVINSQMLYTSWTPADPEAAAALLPDGVPMAGPAYMNQYVVRSDDQTSGFGAYSLTYLGLDIEGMTDPEGVLPGRYMLFYFNSSPVMREYTIREYDLPAEPGETALEIDESSVVATTSVGGAEVIRTEASFGSGIAMVARGQLTYVREKGGKFMAGNFPYIADMADGFEVRSIDFLDSSHPCWALRPTDPLQVETAVSFYSPNDSFVYPGGVEQVVF